MFASEVFLGVKPSAEYLYMVIASPVGRYFKGGAETVTVWVSQDYTRAAPGGTGAAKCGGNYAASLVAQAEAARHGCDQVVFLDAAGRRWVEELGGMNIFFVFDDGSLATPPLGTILPGVTRDSILTLAREYGMTTVERPIPIEELFAGCTSGDITEVFAVGTAAAVTPVVGLKSASNDVMVGHGSTGVLTASLRNHLLDIQFGRRMDTYHWRRPIDRGVDGNSLTVAR
jgi:branched-chain amino acid aminotransferase